VTAVINPNNGPDGCPPNSDYQRGLDDLRSAGVSMLGYVYTSYGTRDVATVKADVDLYDQCYAVDGIFFDEVSSSADDLAYYTGLYVYVKARPNLDTVVLNPGTHIDESYLSDPAADTAVIFESPSDNWPGYVPDSYIGDYPPERFAMLAYNVPDTSTVCAHIDLAQHRGIGYVYLTDDTLPNPWDSLPGYWSAQIDCIEQLNTCTVWLPIVMNTW
jgi:hypothetical protein